eukprot:scaffold39147_cov55-Attheya_sp.AAC.4
MIFQPPQKDDTHNTASPPRVSDTATSQAPRVLRSETTRRQSPRVLETNKMLETVIINQTQVKKKFGRHVFTGTVTKYDQKANLYYIEYTDGDCGEMTEKNIQKYQCMANTRTLNRLKQRLDKQQANQVLQGQMARSLPPHYANAVWDDEAGRMLEFRHLLNHKNPATKKIWDRSGANEYGRLMQGIGKNRKPEERITGMNSMKFIHKQNVPKGKIVTYARFVANIRPQKDEPH